MHNVYLMSSRVLSRAACRILAAAAVGIFLVACGGGGQRTTEPTVIDRPIDGEAGPNVTALEFDDYELGELLARRVVYFDYDSSELTEQGKAVVRAHAQHLARAQDAQIVLEGHTDERGTREYNLALGESRAKTVARVLQAFGVDAARVQTISYGEERPVALGHDDAAWQKNRRVEILY